MWRGVVVACVATAVIGLNATSVGIASRGIHADLGADLVALEWIVGSYLVTAAAFAMLGGRLGDILGRKRAVLIGLGVFAVACAAAALAPSTGALIAARVVQGVGAALVVPASLEVVVAYPPPGGVLRGFRYRSVIYASAFGVGPLIGGVLTDELSWRALFWVEAAVAVAAMVALLPLLAERSEAPKRDTHDLGGGILLAVVLSALVVVASRGRAWGLLSWETVGTVGIAVVAAAAFWWVERRTDQPIVDAALLRDRAVVGANLAALAASVSMVGLVYLFAIFARSAAVFDSSAAGITVSLGAFTASMVLCALAAGALGHRLGPRGPVMVGLGLSVVGFGLLSIVSSDTTSEQVLVPLVVCGIGAGVANAGVGAPAVLTRHIDRVDEAAGLISFTRFAGSAVAVAIGTATYLSVAAAGITSSAVDGGPPRVPTAELIVGGSAYAQAVDGLDADLRAPFEAMIRSGSIDGFTAAMRVTAVVLAALLALSAWLLRGLPVSPAPPPAP